MSQSVSDGHSVEEHVEKALAMGVSLTPDQLIKLEEPECPDTLWYLWEWYEELSMARGAGGMGGVDSIRWNEILAWAQLTCRYIKPYEAWALAYIDTVYRSELMKAESKRAKRS